MIRNSSRTHIEQHPGQHQQYLEKLHPGSYIIKLSVGSGRC